jgi:uncharacterized membrane protein
VTSYAYWLLIGAAALHAIFALCELFPWAFPFVLRLASKKLPAIYAGKAWTAVQQPLVATIVHNAGIYNAILAGGLFWAAQVGDPGVNAARVLLLGAVAAGVFGTVTLKSPITAVQALVGIAGFVLL